MIPPDTTSKEQTHMPSGAGQSPDQAQAARKTRGRARQKQRPVTRSSSTN